MSWLLVSTDASWRDVSRGLVEHVFISWLLVSVLLLFFYRALGQWRRGNIALSTTLPVPRVSELGVIPAAQASGRQIPPSTRKKRHFWSTATSARHLATRCAESVPVTVLVTATPSASWRVQRVRHGKRQGNSKRRQHVWTLLFFCFVLFLLFCC